MFLDTAKRGEVEDKYSQDSSDESFSYYKYIPYDHSAETIPRMLTIFPIQKALTYAYILRNTLRIFFFSSLRISSLMLSLFIH